MQRKGRFRLDELMLSRGLAASIEEARALIMAGEVVVGDQRVDKPGTRLAPEVMIRVKSRGQYVSRGGDKLASAIAALGLGPLFQQAAVMDVGASTGGFTDCCLQLGAALVYAVDVGDNQLAWKLRQDPRVQVHEKTHIKDFTLPTDSPLHWVVADISFNSIRRLLPAILDAVGERRDVAYLLLVKPQFELPSTKIPEGGVVTEEVDRQMALDIVMGAMREGGFTDLRSVASGVTGRSGNQEIFIYGRR